MTVENGNGKKCGKFRNAVGAEGLALLRVSDVIHKGPLSVKTDDGETAATLVPHIPYWWQTDTDTELQTCFKLMKKQ